MATDTTEDAMAEVTWQHVRERVNLMAQERGEWSSYPLPITGYRLVVEKRHPLASLQGATLGTTPEERLLIEALANKEGTDDFEKVRNSWHSWSKRSMVYVIEEKDGRITKCVLPCNYPMERLNFSLGTISVAASAAWSAKAELKAMQKLKLLVKPHAFDHYILAGMFLETSERSGVTYWFRKGRPTLATKGDDKDRVRFLAALCLHPLAYYEGTWAGAMVPTDDVIAHLMLMRADEHMLWRKANHHPLWAVESGV